MAFSLMASLKGKYDWLRDNRKGLKVKRSVEACAKGQQLDNGQAAETEWAIYQIRLLQSCFGANK